MLSPYDALFHRDAQIEEVEGSFACQKGGCYEAADEAEYFIKKKTLVWYCPNGHQSTLEDYELE